MVYAWQSVPLEVDIYISLTSSSSPIREFAHGTAFLAHVLSVPEHRSSFSLVGDRHSATSHEELKWRCILHSQAFIGPSEVLWIILTICHSDSYRNASVSDFSCCLGYVLPASVCWESMAWDQRYARTWSLLESRACASLTTALLDQTVLDLSF